MAKLEDVIRRGTNAARPAATAVAVGTLYYDTTNSTLDRSNGTTWESVEAGGVADAILDTLLDAKGDLIVASAADTAARLAVGTDGHVLTADSAQATGVKWAAASGASVPTPWALVPDTGAVFSAGPTAIGAANRAVIVPALLLADATITGIQLRIGTQSGNISVGLYNSSLTRVATSGSVACPASGIAAVSFTGNYSATAGRYYIGLSASNNTVTFALNSSSTLGAPLHSKYMETAHPLPDPFVSAGASPIVPAMLGLINGGWSS